jgi:hypothetical protein
VPQAFKIQHFYFTFGHTHPAQEPAGLETYGTAKDKASGVVAVEAVIAPALFGSFEATATSAICCVAVVVTAHSIETDPA